MRNFRRAKSILLVLRTIALNSAFLGQHLSSLVKTTSVQEGKLVLLPKLALRVARTSPTAFPRQLGGFQVNPDAVLERRDDPAISSNADPLDIGHLAHVRRGLFDVAPLARHSTEGD